MKSIISLSLLTVGFLTSCADPYKSQITQNFNKSINVNAIAESHVEWEASPDNSITLFTTLRDSFSKLDLEKKKSFQSAVCAGLSELSISSIMVFQDELNKPENTELIGEACQTKLVTRINTQTEDQISKFEYKVNPSDLTLTRPLDFKLDSKIVNLDKVLTTKQMIEQLQDGEIVITFDDGPDAIATGSILNTLKAAGDVKAMFFTKGANIEAHPGKIETEFQQGHAVVNHSWNHLCLKDTKACVNTNKKSGVGELSDEDVINEINSTFELIKKRVGEMAPFFRFPYGEAREATSKYLREHGVFEVGWNLDTNDWKKVQALGITVKASGDATKTIATKSEVPFTAQDVMDSTIRQLKLRKKGIILFHDVHIRTAEILPQFLYELHKLNFKVVQFKSKPQAETRENP